MADDSNVSDRAIGSATSSQARGVVPFVRPTLPPFAQYAERLASVWESRMLSNFGAQAKEFETRVRDYMALENVCAVGNCDLGLTLAIAALGLPEQSEAIVPSFTFNATANAVLWNGLVPRFVDVQPDSYCVDPVAVAEAINDRTRLIVGTHVFGVACDVEALERIAATKGIPLLFDAAHAIGTWLGGRHVAAYGDVSVFSFSGTKVVTSGEGGIAVFKESDRASRFQYLRSYGFHDDYVTRYVGLNGKLSEIHAALGCLTLAGVETVVERRAELFAAYRRGLSGLDGVCFQEIPAGVRSSHTYFAIDVADRRDDLAQYLRGVGIETKSYFKPLHAMPIFADAPRSPLPSTERLGRSILCLPLYPDMEDGTVAYVCARVREFFASLS